MSSSPAQPPDPKRDRFQYSLEEGGLEAPTEKAELRIRYQEIEVEIRVPASRTESLLRIGGAFTVLAAPPFLYVAVGADVSGLQALATVLLQFVCLMLLSMVPPLGR